MNDQNLKPFRAGEARAVEAGRKGGIASGVARRERFRQLLLSELDGEDQVFIPPPSIPMSAEDILDEGHYAPAGYTVRAGLVKTLVAKAKDGDLKALAMILSLSECDDGGDENVTVEARANREKDAVTEPSRMPQDRRRDRHG